MPLPISMIFKYTSMILFLVHNTSRQMVTYISNPLRIQLRLGVKNKFLAVCWLMVLAPLSFLPPFMERSIAFCICSKSKPKCFLAKALSWIQKQRNNIWIKKWIHWESKNTKQWNATWQQKKFQIKQEIASKQLLFHSSR